MGVSIPQAVIGCMQLRTENSPSTRSLVSIPQAVIGCMQREAAHLEKKAARLVSIPQAVIGCMQPALVEQNCMHSHGFQYRKR